MGDNDRNVHSIRKGIGPSKQRHTAESFQAMAREGGIATRNRYGNEFFREIRKKRRFYIKGYVTRKTKQKMHQMMVDMHKAESNPFSRWAMQLYLESQKRNHGCRWQDHGIRILAKS